MTAPRWTDDDGHTWPVTGQWCTACGLPLTPTAHTPTTHPTCEPENDR